ncbi:MAG: hypothetical protein KJ970_17180 [Candidatus Eisenbacteria bacterium]|uniref:Uncharacterized protein n=1 Tax=Eiseniibacteriota bacterium TaxID=2212470 RepID=A0A948W8F8_UNCEI|nr:hypothetical protein [Candidatus Eisenbacteria bacterium]MBU1950710.1 hypothetical protein [Candidatus Eisenbacteria bacterium]MBU2692651.1 hypothetical protein [Candidatus Eisenbacteria bacterium]
MNPRHGQQSPHPARPQRSRIHRRFLRDFQAGGHLDLFLVAAVSSVLVIRFYLDITGYPKIGLGQLHIAHLLWGGLLMTTCVVLALSYLDRGARELAALVGGVGFGMFIDEVGKFVTRDNDYFFQPAPAIIYVIFIIVYLAVRSIHRERIATREEYLVNALKETEELALRDLSSEERDRALFYLEQSGSREPLAVGLRALLQNADLVSDRPGQAERWRRRAIDIYRRITELALFHTTLVLFFIGQLIVKLLYVALLLDKKGRIAIDRIPWPGRALTIHRMEGFADAALLGSSLLAAALVAAGVFLIRRSRLQAYRMFQRSILVSILFGQVFMFYREEWGALIGLAFNLFLFIALRYMIEREVSLSYEGISARDK